MTTPISTSTTTLVTIAFLIGAVLVILAMFASTLKTNQKHNAANADRLAAKEARQEAVMARNRVDEAVLDRAKQLKDLLDNNIQPESNTTTEAATITDSSSSQLLDVLDEVVATTSLSQSHKNVTQSPFFDEGWWQSDVPDASDTQIVVCYWLPAWTMGLLAWCLESLVAFSYNVLVGTPPTIVRVMGAGFMAGFAMWFHTTLHRSFLSSLADPDPGVTRNNSLVAATNRFLAKPWREAVLSGAWLATTFAAYNIFAHLPFVMERVVITILVMFIIFFIPARLFRAEINRVENLNQQSQAETENKLDA